MTVSMPDSDPVPQLIVAAFESGRRMPDRERMVAINDQLSAEVQRLAARARAVAQQQPMYSRDWYRLTNAADAAEFPLRFELGLGPLAASIHVTQLARGVLALRKVLGEDGE
ncbi:DUF6415 family natural product biosynthesis protein [Streptomyces mexicanus]|jgi:hypothetical protein|uniref:Uncharacterized protein n=1 Tax=Streptomyces mexicanus TaxID=178566 RepID=A0A7X1HWP1_9ACTN|nr:DUF6415 family natural product biosynthesis protein [Streptomyces mexicanus]MBC2864421.1 hypothetical protein [Streptomyces mexicanus]